MEHAYARQRPSLIPDNRRALLKALLAKTCRDVLAGQVSCRAASSVPRASFPPAADSCSRQAGGLLTTLSPIPILSCLQRTRAHTYSRTRSCSNMSIDGSSVPELPRPDSRIIQMLCKPASRTSILFLGTLSQRDHGRVRISDHAHELLQSLGSRTCQEVVPSLYRILIRGTFIRPTGSYEMEDVTQFWFMMESLALALTIHDRLSSVFPKAIGAVTEQHALTASRFANAMIGCPGARYHANLRTSARELLAAKPKLYFKSSSFGGSKEYAQLCNARRKLRSEAKSALRYCLRRSVYEPTDEDF